MTVWTRIKRWFVYEEPKPKLHELHRYEDDDFGWCALCKGEADNAKHLYPSHRPLTIYDVTERPAQGSLLAVAAAACYVDHNAVVYQAEGYPGVVFIELMDAALYARAKAEVWLHKTMVVVAVFVGLGD